MSETAKRANAADAQLLARATRGDADAFAQLFDRHAPPLRAWLRLQTRDPQAAADLLSETFAQAWTHRARFRDHAGGSAAPWLFGIARNLLADWRRRGRVEATARQKLGMQAHIEAVEPLRALDDELTPELEAALATLPATQRAALELRVLDELDYPAIAAHLGSSEGGARNRVHRALSALRGALEGGQP
jgi:RNA polymerase sigma factor (sigma-70 family)